MALSTAEYDALSPEEQKAHDATAREQELCVSPGLESSARRRL